MKNTPGVVFEKQIKCRCGETAKYRDSVRRMVRIEYGKRIYVNIPRYICQKCGKYRVLPAYILPYKHYRKDIMEGFRSGYFTKDLLEFEDYPCDLTVYRWSRINCLLV